MAPCIDAWWQMRWYSSDEHAAQGLGHTTMFCGDGINDIAALSAADVGLAVGATDAVIAATLSTSQGSVAGKCPVLLLYNLGQPLPQSTLPLSASHTCEGATNIAVASGFNSIREL